MLSKSVNVISEMAYSKSQDYLAEIKAGRARGLDWSEDVKAGKVTLREMIGTDSGAEEFLAKITLEAYQEMEKPENQPLFNGFYNLISDATLPKYIAVEEMGPFGIVFLQVLEGDEVKFGTLEPGQEKIISLQTMGAGLEYTEDMVEYNQLFKVTEMARQFGKNYIQQLNWASFAPFINGTFVTTGGGLLTQKQYQNGDGGVTPTAQLIAWNTSVQQTLRDAITVLPEAKYILCNSADQLLVEDAIAGSMLPDLQPSAVKRKLSTANIVVWDGFAIKVGAKTYTYAPIQSGYIYLVSGAKTNFKWYEKHGLRITSDDGDLSRLIVSQVVGRARGAQYAALAGPNGAVKVKITS